MALIPLDEIEPGMVVSMDVKNHLGQLLLPSGIALTEKHISALRQWKIHEVPIGDDLVKPLSSMIPQDILDEARKSVQDRFAHTDLLHSFIETLFESCIERTAMELATRSKDGR